MFVFATQGRANWRCSDVGEALASHSTSTTPTPGVVASHSTPTTPTLREAELRAEDLLIDEQARNRSVSSPFEQLSAHVEGVLNAREYLARREEIIRDRIYIRSIQLRIARLVPLADPPYVAFNIISEAQFQQRRNASHDLRDARGSLASAIQSLETLEQTQLDYLTHAIPGVVASHSTPTTPTPGVVANQPTPTTPTPGVVVSHSTPTTPTLREAEQRAEDLLIDEQARNRSVSSPFEELSAHVEGVLNAREYLA
jgi:hypothetical protein